MNTFILSPASALSFILAGQATITIRKPSTGGRFTYKISIPRNQKPEEAKIWFVSVLSGSDNTGDYSYIGFIRDRKFFHGGAKAKARAGAPSVVVFEVVFNRNISRGVLDPKLEVWHEGRCGRCGRKLTVPESIESGIGPECARIQTKFHNQLKFSL
jgi:hypothetical protein